MREAIDHFVEGHRRTLVDLCAALVSAPSINPPGDVRGPAEVVRRFLGSHGIETDVADAKPEKPNLVAAVEGSGPGRHLVFNGHLDTLQPDDETRWSVPIFEMGRKDGRLTGLGIGNMKAGLAALALATVYCHERRADWRGRLTFTAVADETIFGPDGAGFLLDARPDLAGDALICAEGPGAMQLAIAEKGLLWIEIVATAAPGQGMTSTRGSGAIARLAEVVAELDRMNDLRLEPPADVDVLRENAGEHGLKVSVNCGRIMGGHFISQLASRAVTEIDFRVPPGMMTADIEARVDAAVRRWPDVSWRRIKGWEPSWTAPGEAVATAMRAAAAIVRGAAPSHVVRMPASDAARWRQRGVPSICYGPQPTLAAGIDDYVFEQDVVDCAKVYALAAIDYLGAGGQ